MLNDGNSEVFPFGKPNLHYAQTINYRMRLLLIFTISTFIAVTSFAQERAIKTTDIINRDYYTAITFLSEGQTKWTQQKNGDETGVAFRTVITTSEIYDNLIIEKVVYGSEGGGKKVVSKRKVDLNYLWTAFNLTGEIAGVHFIKWLSWNSFELKIGDKRYVVKNIDSSSVKVTRA